MIAVFGKDASKATPPGMDARIVWEPSNLTNPHVAFLGASGTGKTHQLRRFIDQVRTFRGVRVHVFDVHGDIAIPGASTVDFTEHSPYGLNPLIVDADPATGGVRRRIADVIGAINKTSRMLGSKQEAVLRAMLTDLYAARGFYQDKPASWALSDGVPRRYPKAFPTLTDLKRFGLHKLKQMYLGSDSEAVQALEKVMKVAQSLQAKTMAANRQGAGQDAQQGIEKLQDAAVDAYTKFVRGITTGRELDDVMRYDSRDVLKSVVERVENLEAIAVFRGGEPPFDPSCSVYRYNLRALRLDERRLFVQWKLEEMYRHAVARGESKSVRDVVVLDEAKNYKDTEDDSILDTLAAEIRKFGVALIAAGQQPSHFTDNFLANCGTKVLLGIDEGDWNKAEKSMSIKREALQWVQRGARQRCAIQSKVIRGSSAWRWGYLGDGPGTAV